ncbi:hypothetical protein, partial [Enterococcus hirae]|uniref:hypothetical protein n=3 Tax=Enterococcus TaxID=1350 RepID=UPI00356A7A63
MPNKEQEKTENVQKKSTESNPSTTKEKEDKAVEQAIATVMRDGDITHDPSRIFLDLKYEFEDSPFISEKRAEVELNKFMKEYREKEDKENKAVEQVEKEDKENKAVEQAIATVMHDGDIPHDPSRIFLDLKYEFEDSPFISEKRAE